jgi:hypothetical protein
MCVRGLEQHTANNTQGRYAMHLHRANRVRVQSDAAAVPTQCVVEDKVATCSLLDKDAFLGIIFAQIAVRSAGAGVGIKVEGMRRTVVDVVVMDDGMGGRECPDAPAL